MWTRSSRVHWCHCPLYLRLLDASGGPYNHNHYTCLKPPLRSVTVRQRLRRHQWPVSSPPPAPTRIHYGIHSAGGQPAVPAMTKVCVSVRARGWCTSVTHIGQARCPEAVATPPRCSRCRSRNTPIMWAARRLLEGRLRFAGRTQTSVTTGRDTAGRCHNGVSRQGRDTAACRHRPPCPSAPVPAMPHPPPLMTAVSGDMFLFDCRSLRRSGVAVPVATGAAFLFGQCSLWGQCSVQRIGEYLAIGRCSSCSGQWYVPVRPMRSPIFRDMFLFGRGTVFNIR